MSQEKVVFWTKLPYIRYLWPYIRYLYLGYPGDKCGFCENDLNCQIHWLYPGYPGNWSWNWQNDDLLGIYCLYWVDCQLMLILQKWPVIRYLYVESGVPILGYSCWLFDNNHILGIYILNLIYDHFPIINISFQGTPVPRQYSGIHPSAPLQHGPVGYWNTLICTNVQFPTLVIQYPSSAWTHYMFRSYFSMGGG